MRSTFDTSLQIIARFLLFCVALPCLIVSMLGGMRFQLSHPASVSIFANDDLRTFIISSAFAVVAALVSVAFSLNRSN